MWFESTKLNQGVKMEEVFKVFCIPKHIENSLLIGDKF
jgi:hypothetical protein